MMDISALFTYLLSPTPLTFTFALLIVLLAPLTLHHFVFHAPSAPPTILLLGPPSSGKTTLQTTLAHTPATTRTSQAPSTLRTTLADAPFLLHDTPGHPKLRAAALEPLSAATTTATLFVLDAAAPLDAAAEYLFDVLRALQRRDRARPARLLVACNKGDLFTALPPTRVRRDLQAEIGGILSRRGRGVAGVGEEEMGEEEPLAGGEGEGWSFDGFGEETAVTVEFRGGSAVSKEGWGAVVEAWVAEWV